MYLYGALSLLLFIVLPILQSQMACRQLEQRLVEDLADPDMKHVKFLEEMLNRVRSNNGECRYEWKQQFIRAPSLV